MKIILLLTIMILGTILFEHAESDQKRVLETTNRKLGKAALSFHGHNPPEVNFLHTEDMDAVCVCVCVCMCVFPIYYYLFIIIFRLAENTD